MPIHTACSSCGKNLRVRDELTGKKVMCPACGTSFVVAAVSDETVTADEPKSRPAPVQDKVSAKLMGKKPPPLEDEDGDQFGEPPIRSREKRGSKYVPCPECSSRHANKVGFTWWGGLVGPWLLTHVKCDECGTTFNGATGKSNTSAIAVYVSVSFVIALALMFLVFVSRL
jgi:DNA-directed RNA polymerase subunit RPC12/RpoP